MYSNKIPVIMGLLSAVVVYDGVISIANIKRFKQMKTALREVVEMNIESHELVDYLCEIMKREEVKITEFDLIALRTLNLEITVKDPG
jgi:hypothetical protein